VKTTGVVGGEERGYDPGKKVKGRKRHLLVDTQGLVLKAKVHAASVFDRDGIKPLMELVGDRFPRLAHLWLDAGYNGKGKGRDWAEEVFGLTVEVVRPPKSVGMGSPRPRASAVAGFHGPAEEVGGGEDVLVDRPEPPDEQEGLREADGHQRGVFVYVAMSRLMAKRLARSLGFSDGF
jgi:transposase